MAALGLMRTTQFLIQVPADMAGPGALVVQGSPDLS
jgi:hypothetical protein